MSTRNCAKELREIASALDLYQAEHKTAQEMGFVDCDEALSHLKRLILMIQVIEARKPIKLEDIEDELNDLFHMVDS